MDVVLKFPSRQERINSGDKNQIVTLFPYGVLGFFPILSFKTHTHTHREFMLSWSIQFFFRKNIFNTSQTEVEVVALKLWFSQGVTLLLRRYLTMSGDVFNCYKLHPGVEVRNATYNAHNSSPQNRIL